MNTTEIITEILRAEGWPKYTDRVSDRGGPTKGGITLATLSKYRGRTCTAEDVKALTETEVRQIYAKMYIADPGYDGIADAALKGLVVDSGVLFGPDDASPWLQQAAVAAGAAIKVDGAVGSRTIAAVNALPARKLQLLICAYRLRKIAGIVTADARKQGRTDDMALQAVTLLSPVATDLEQASGESDDGPVLAAAIAMRKIGASITTDAKSRGRTKDQALNCHGWCNRLADFVEDA